MGKQRPQCAPNISLKPTRLAGEKGMEPGPPGCARVKAVWPDLPSRQGGASAAGRLMAEGPLPEPPSGLARGR